MLILSQLCKYLHNKNGRNSYGYSNPTGFRWWGKVAKSSGSCYTSAMETWKSKNRNLIIMLSTGERELE